MGSRAHQDIFPDENLSKKNPSPVAGEVGVLSGEPVCNPAGVSGGEFISSEIPSCTVCSVL